MTIESNFITLLMVLAFAGVLMYRITSLHKKTIGYFSLLQIIYLVVIPGFILPLAFTYLQSVLNRPLNPVTVLPDTLIVNIILLSILFTYGGVAIHSVSKMLSNFLRYDKSEVGDMNRFFHMTFSHNLIYGGTMFTLLGLVLLELNHTPKEDPISLSSGVLKGLILGGIYVAALYFYTKPEDEYAGRYAELKFSFMILWLVFMLLLYGLRKIDPTLTEYNLLLPALLSFAILAFLNVVLVVRRLKRGGFKLKFNFQRLFSD